MVCRSGLLVGFEFVIVLIFKVEKFQTNCIAARPTAPREARRCIPYLYFKELRHLRHHRRFYACAFSGEVDHQAINNRRAKCAVIQLASLENAMT